MVYAALTVLLAAPAWAADSPTGAGCLADATRAASAQGRAADGARDALQQLLVEATSAAVSGNGEGCRKAADAALEAAGLPRLAPILLSTSIAGEARGAQAQVPAAPRPGAPAGSANVASSAAAPPSAPSLAVPRQPTAGPAAVQQASAVPGDPAHGQSVAKVCSACHSLDKGGQIRVGPPLYGVDGRQVAAVQGFSYSGALRAKAGDWDDATLNAFLKSPRSYAPGTRMAYPGIANDRDRADVVAYLKTLK